MEWRFIKGTTRYYVSDCGEVKVVYPHRERILKPSVNNTYHGISLTIDGSNKYCKIHRLVAEAFIPNPDNKPFVNHINGNKTDNRVENLEWVTAQENALHARTHLPRKRSSNGVKVYCYDRNGNLLKIYPSMKSTVQDGFSQTCVSQCCRDGLSHKGLIFSVKELPKEHFKDLMIGKEYMMKKVYQYTIDGKLLNSYKSSVEAGKITGVLAHAIADNCKGILKTAGGYVWSRVELSPEYFNSKNLGREYKTKSVLQIDLITGDVIKEWDCMMDAKRAGFNLAGIINCCNGRIKSSKGFAWKYKAPNEYNIKNVIIGNRNIQNTP